MRNVKGIIVAGAVLVALIAGGLWLRGYKQRLRLEGALAEAMKNVVAQRNADSLALAAAQDSLRVTRAALATSSARVAMRAGNWASERATAPAVLAQPGFGNPAPDSSVKAAPVSDTLVSIVRYAHRLEASGDSLARACTSLRDDCETFRAQATVTMARQDSLRADIQRQLDITTRQLKNQPGTASRWVRNAGWFLAGIGAGLVLERSK